MTNDTHAPANQEAAANILKQIKPEPDVAAHLPEHPDFRDQLSLHFGEISEMMEVLARAAVGYPSQEQLLFARNVLEYLRRQIGSSEVDFDLEALDHPALLKALDNQIAASKAITHLILLNVDEGVSGLAQWEPERTG